MDYDLRRPCKKYPFRCDIPAYLRAARVEELEDTLETGEFPCHETVDYKLLEKINSEYSDDEDDGYYVPSDIGEKAKHCAGALILLEKMGRPIQMMRICERIGLYDRTKLDMDAPIYDSFEEMIDVQPR